MSIGSKSAMEGGDLNDQNKKKEQWNVKSC